MAAVYNDGTVQYGSREWKIHSSITVPTVRGTYVCDNITVNRPTKAIDRTNQLGEPSGSVGIADFVTGSATVQLVDGNAVEPRNGDMILCNGDTDDFNDQLDSGVGDELFFITSVTRNEAKDAERKVSITFKKAYATSIP